MQLSRPASTVLSLVVGAAFFTLWFWLFPIWLHFQFDFASIPLWRKIAIVPAILGFTVAIRCIWDFGSTGHGTPAPILPPDRLVVVGFYRYVRNPMYVGFFCGWLSLWAVFGHTRLAAVIVAAVVILSVHFFVVFYEEPTLRRMFGAEYEAYCRNVGRWIPRLTPWKQPLAEVAKK